MITTKDKIGYIRRKDTGNGFAFDLFDEPIKKIYIGKKKKSVYTDRFFALDIEELEDNTELMEKNPAIILVGEPFIMSDELRGRCQNAVEYWNAHGAESVLGTKYPSANPESGV